MKEFNTIDLFCGCGGLSLGFKQAGFNCLLAVDSWKDAIETFKFNFPDVMAICDLIDEDSPKKYREILKNKKIHVVIGGPPCQGFSTVGTNRKGRRDPEDPRNSLYVHFLAVVNEFQPDFVLIENVKGMKTIAGGQIFSDMISKLKALGYKVKHEIMNASGYGVPQNRERLFTVGYRTQEYNLPLPFSKEISTMDAINDLPSLDDLELDNTHYVNYEVQTEYQRCMRMESNVIFNHERTAHSDETKRIISMIKDGGRITDLDQKYWNIRKYNKAFQRMDSRKPSHTIDTGHRNYFHYRENRVPSVRECARIQSFPDNFIFRCSRTSQYRQVGNAVPPRLARELALSIIKKYNEVKYYVKSNFNSTTKKQLQHF